MASDGARNALGEVRSWMVSQRIGGAITSTSLFNDAGVLHAVMIGNRQTKVGAATVRRTKPRDFRVAADAFLCAENGRL